jgi:ribosomal protein S20
MPIIKSAIKRAKQTINRRERNVGIKRDIKEATKAFLAKPTAEGLSAAHSEIDTAVKKKLLKKNTAARRKAQLSKAAKDAGVKLATGKKTAPKAPVVAKAAPKAAVVAKTAPKKVAKPAAVKVAAKPVAKKPVAKKAPAKKTTTK